MRNEDYKTKTVQPSELLKGDTIIVGNDLKTVDCKTVRTGFCGTTVDGIRMKSVTLVLFPKWYKGELVDYVRNP